MPLSIDSITALAAKGRAPLLIATALGAAGAGFRRTVSNFPLRPLDERLIFVVDLEAWAVAYGLDRIEREFPGLYVQIQHSQVFGDAVVWQIYESMLTVSLYTSPSPRDR